MGSGLNTQVGYAEESSWSVPVTVTKFLPHVDNTIKYMPHPVQGQGIQAGLYAEQSSLRANVSSMVGGDLNFDFTSKGMGIWLKHALGSITSVQNGSTAAYTHTATEGSQIAGKGLTIQGGMARTGTTVDPYTYAGCKVNSWELSCAQNDILKFKASVVGQSMATATALASPSYPTANNIFFFKQGQVTVNGSPYVAFKDFTLTGDNSLTTDQRLYIGSGGLIGEPISNNFRKISLKGTADYIDTTLSSAFIADSEMTVVLQFGGVASGVIPASKKIVTGPPDYYEQLIITVSGLRLNGDVPTVSGPDLLSIPFDADALTPNAGGSRISIAYTSLDVTP